MLGQIYAARIWSESTICCGWSADGNAVCPAPTITQAFPSLVTDGDEGAVVSWVQDTPSADTFDVYAQHIDSTGAAGALVDVPTFGINLALAMSLAPNPGKGGTTIHLNLPQAGQLTIRVYDALGRRIRRLLDGATSAGPVSIYWDGRSESGESVAPGIYLVRAQAANNTVEKRLSIIR